MTTFNTFEIYDQMTSPECHNSELLPLFVPMRNFSEKHAFDSDLKREFGNILRAANVGSEQLISDSDPQVETENFVPQFRVNRVDRLGTALAALKTLQDVNLTLTDVLNHMSMAI
jgi:hypothetical protein